MIILTYSHILGSLLCYTVRVEICHTWWSLGGPCVYDHGGYGGEVSVHGELESQSGPHGCMVSPLGKSLSPQEVEGNRAMS